MTLLIPASLEDLRHFVAPAPVWDEWARMWSSPYAKTLFDAMKPSLLVGEDPFAVLGVSTLAAPDGKLYPWVWAVPHATVRPTLAQTKEGIRIAREWLDDHARGHCTTPQVWEDPSYAKLLRVVGFTDHGSGVWTWRS